MEDHDTDESDIHEEDEFLNLLEEKKIKDVFILSEVLTNPQFDK